jgi:hypothetical protein
MEFFIIVQFNGLLLTPESSNFCELANLVLSIEEAVSDGLLQFGELFMFTDNSLVESMHHKGLATRKELFELV